jgi:5-methylcytosine-specific restriction endonuclease McrA
MNIRTLLLDKNWQPIKLITWESAIKLLVSEKAQTVSEYTDQKVRSATKSFSIPAILRTNAVSQHNPAKVACTSSNVFVRDKNSCAYCGEKMVKSQLTVDHIVPLVQGGKWEWINLITACRPCNQRKGGRTPKQAGMNLLYKPKEPRWSIMFNIRLSKNDKVEYWRDYLYGLDFSIE